MGCGELHRLAGFGLSPPLLTTDAAMFAVIRAATRAGQADSPILVTGETGTGKELLVRLIHAASGRTGGMSSVNCAALNDAALFWDLRVPRQKTRLKSANDASRGAEAPKTGSTSYALPPIPRCSSTRSRNSRPLRRRGCCARYCGLAIPWRARSAPGARLVSATNRPLGPMVSNGRFKRELYDRLAVLTLGVPPLRERRADIELLAAGFLRAAAPRLSFTPEALKALGGYPFPGNVRELHNLVTRFAIMPRDGASQLIDAADVRPELLGPAISPGIVFDLEVESVPDAARDGDAGADGMRRRSGSGRAQARHQRSRAPAARGRRAQARRPAPRSG